jgi:hypothetical protein
VETRWSPHVPLVSTSPSRRGTYQRDGRGLTESFDPCLPCVLKLMSVFCVHSVLEHQQEQLYLPEDRSRAAPDQGKRYGPLVREGGMDLHHNTNLTQLGHSPPASQPGGLPCWVISLAFGLIGTYCKPAQKGDK